MKFISVIVLLVLCNVVFAQKILIEGKITDQASVPLMGATIQLNDGVGTVSNTEGNFKIESLKSQDEFRLVIRMIGYATIDTTIFSPSPTDGQASENNIYLNIKMNAVNYETPLVEITGSGFNVFKYSKWKIVDFQFYDDNILILYISKRKYRIGLFTLSGLKIDEVKLKGKYTQLFKSCKNGFHLIGDVDCAELQIVDSKITKTIPYKRIVFEKLIKPCILKIDGELIFQEFSKHNKKVKYYKFAEPTQPVLIKEIFDQQGAKSSQGAYNQVIREYFRELVNPEEEDGINEGVQADNIIAKGEWKGDLSDLIINNKMHFLVSNYQNVETAEIPVLEFEYDNHLFVLDFYHEKISKSNVVKLEDSELTLMNFEWNKKSKIIKDEESNKVYLLINKSELFSVKLNTNACELIPHSKIELKGSYAEGIKIYNNQLYYHSSVDANNRKSKLYRKKL